MLNIAFVCTGNICRSVMAEEYLKKRIGDLQKQTDIKVFSCGIKALDGEEATQKTKQSMKKYGLDIQSHQAVNIKNINIDNMDYIICMTKAHKDKIISLYPKVCKKIFILKELVSKEKYADIDNPWGHSINVYEKAAKEIVENVDKLIERILKEV